MGFKLFRITVFLVFLFIPSFGFCNLDSLDQEIEKHYQNGNIDEVLKCQHQKIKIITFYNGQVEKGLNISKKALKLAIQNDKHLMVANLSYTIGFIYIEFLDDFENGMKYYFNALSYYDEHKNNYNKHVGLLLNMANAFYMYQSFDQAIKYNNIGLKLAMKQNDPDMTASFHTNLGSCFDAISNKKKALIHWNKSLQFYDKVRNELSYFEVKVNILGAKLFDSHTEEELEEMIQFYEDAIPVFKKHEATNNILVCHKNLGTLLNKEGKFKKAQPHLKKALNIANRSGSLELKSYCFEALATNYNGLKEYKKEAEMRKQLQTVHDSLFALNKTEAIAATQTKYETEKKEKENQILRQEKEIQETKAEKEQIIRYGLTVGIVLIVIFLGLVINRFVKTSKQKQIIEDQKDKVDEAFHELETKNKEILDSIVYAQRIQKAILPPDDIFNENLPNSFILYLPKDIVAGDFYWLETKQNQVLVAAADCTGHGVPGAMVSVVCNNGLNRSVREKNLTEPGKILDKTREIVIEEFEKSVNEVRDGMDIALTSITPPPGDKSVEKYQLQYAGAHNPLWIIRKDSNEIEEYKANKLPIGKFDRSEPYTTHTIDIYPGDTFYIFSDGYADQFGGIDEFNNKPGGKKFKAKNLKKLFLSINNFEMPKQRQMLKDTFLKWKGDLEQLDDVCIIGVRI